MNSVNDKTPRREHVRSATRAPLAHKHASYGDRKLESIRNIRCTVLQETQKTGRCVRLLRKSFKAHAHNDCCHAQQMTSRKAERTYYDQRRIFPAGGHPYLCVPVGLWVYACSLDRSVTTRAQDEQLSSVALHFYFMRRRMGPQILRTVETGVRSMIQVPKKKNISYKALLIR